MSHPRAVHEWRRRVNAEYRSAAVTAEVLHGLIRCGLSDGLINTALRIVRDELDHASLAHDVVRALGGEDCAVEIDVSTLARQERPEGPLATVVDRVLHDFCLGETLAVPLFHAMYRHTRHPEAVAVLERVLRDEAVHRAFGWAALDELLAIDPDGIRAWCTARLSTHLASFESAYAPSGQAAPLTDAQREAGLLSLDAYREVFWTTVRGDISKRFSRRGIAVPDRYTADGAQPELGTSSGD